jgi:hypothetical protein
VYHSQYRCNSFFQLRALPLVSATAWPTGVAHLAHGNSSRLMQMCVQDTAQFHESIDA